MLKKIGSIGLLLMVGLSGCSSAKKARMQEREKLVHSKGVYCDFVSESDFNDVEIELNLRLAKKCDASKPFSISSYKRVSENPGVLYCCNSEGFNESAGGSASAAAPAPTSSASGTPAAESSAKGASAK